MIDYNRVTILLVEDDDGHARLVEKNLRRAGFNNQLHRFENGKQVIDYIFNNGPKEGSIDYSSMLMLLDLNMPIMGGVEVLEKIKSDESTKIMPVVILTTTDDHREVKKCYELGCNIYITKPVEYDKFTNAIMQLGLFLSVISIPSDR